jgi:hypothetical protein
LCPLAASRLFHYQQDFLILLLHTYGVAAEAEAAMIQAQAEMVPLGN